MFFLSCQTFFFTYASFYFAMFFIFVEFLVVVYFVLLKHSLHHVKNYLVVVNMVYASRWIRIAQWIHVYDVKSCFAHGCHGVGSKEGRSLKGENANRQTNCLGSNRCNNRDFCLYQEHLSLKCHHYDQILDIPIFFPFSYTVGLS